MGVILPRPVVLDPVTREIKTDPRNYPALWTPSQRYVWDKAVFTVPDSVPEERVQFSADRYRLRYGKALEMQGFTVLWMGRPEQDSSVVAVGTTDPDRRRYVIWAQVTRRPVTVTVDVPDEDVPIYQKAGYRLT